MKLDNLKNWFIRCYFPIYVVIIFILIQVVVRNALQAGNWGNEEREGKIPFEKGVGSDLKIVNEEYGFQVS